MNENNRYTLSTEDLTKVGKGAIVAGVGALLAYLLETAPNIELGEWGIVATAVLSVFANLLRKWGSNTSK